MNNEVDFNDEIESIEYIGENECIDIEVSGNHYFYANDVLVKNSLGTPATADAFFILGTNNDSMIYESEIWCKIVKNRLGGMIGHSFKFYMDSRSLKMYDESELDMWMNDATISGAERKLSRNNR